MALGKSLAGINARENTKLQKPNTRLHVRPAISLAIFSQNPDSCAMSGTILFVDDERQMRDMAANYFHNFGYEFLAAENADDALRLASAHPVDVFVLDVNLTDLTGKDGSNLITALKRKHSNTPVILFSGLAREDHEVKDMLKAGAHQFVAKVDSLNDLLKAVQKVMKR
jgi:DNA-binding response OmpR family regulator